jgi:hypothetical protein
VRRLTIAEAASPALTLHHDPQTGAWSGELAGREITGSIQRDKADALLNKLASFNADTWVTDRTEGYEALRNPALVVQILAIDPLNPGSPPAPRTLAFAPAAKGSANSALYGRLDQNPDIFLISRDQYREITAPVVK